MRALRCWCGGQHPPVQRISADGCKGRRVRKAGLGQDGAEVRRPPVNVVRGGQWQGQEAGCEGAARREGQEGRPPGDEGAHTGGAAGGWGGAGPAAREESHELRCLVAPTTSRLKREHHQAAAAGARQLRARALFARLAMRSAAP